MNNLLSNSIIARCKLKISKWRSTVKSYIENFKKYRFLLWELVKKGVKLKYRRSYLGILWTYATKRFSIFSFSILPYTYILPLINSEMPLIPISLI